DRAGVLFPHAGFGMKDGLPSINFLNGVLLVIVGLVAGLIARAIFILNIKTKFLPTAFIFEVFH
ncbi:MAG: hypothetical protein QXM65_08275, partial [Candidatus Bathyarchaeia archaeon]